MGAGVATLSRVAPIKTTLGLGVEDSSTPSYELDREGRVIISEFKDIYVVRRDVAQRGHAATRKQTDACACACHPPQKSMATAPLGLKRVAWRGFGLRRSTATRPTAGRAWCGCSTAPRATGAGTPRWQPRSRSWRRCAGGAGWWCPCAHLRRGREQRSARWTQAVVHAPSCCCACGAPRSTSPWCWSATSSAWRGITS